MAVDEPYHQAEKDSSDDDSNRRDDVRRSYDLKGMLWIEWDRVFSQH